MDGIISVANGSSSSLYGCIGCAVKDMIISKFPKEYFKYVAVSSELATRNIRRTFGGNNSNVEIKKRLKPYLILQPTYSVMDQDGPLQGIPLTKNFDNLQYRTDKRYLFDVIKDTKNNFNLKFKLNRDRIEFDVTVTTSTLHQQLDIYRMILNQFIWDRSYTFRIALESIIPKELIYIMSKYCNMDLDRSESYIPLLLRRLNSCSGYPITYKLKHAPSTDEWFMYYTHNVIITFSDLTIESGNKKNMVDDAYNITFRVIAEFNMPGVYMLDGTLDSSKLLDSTSNSNTSSDGTNYLPMFAISNLQSRFPSELNGMQLYGTTMFKTTASADQDEDRVDIKCVLDNDHIRVIRAHNAWNMDPSTLLSFYILKNDEVLSEGVDYIVDWNTLELVMYNIDNDSTYRLIMYFNYATVNEILNNSAYHNNYDVNKPRDNILPDKGMVEGEITTHGKDGIIEVVGNYDVEEDPTYCSKTEHGNIDPGPILHPSTETEPSFVIPLAEPLENFSLSEINNEEGTDTEIDSIDSMQDIDVGVDISEIIIATDTDTEDTNADIHNSTVSTKTKKYFSSI